MEIKITDTAIEAVASVLSKLPKDVQGKVIEATSQLLTIAKRANEDTTGHVGMAMEELYHTLPSEVQQGVCDAFEAIIHNVEAKKPL